MKPAPATSTFRSLLTITAIAVGAALAVMWLEVPMYAAAFAGALAFVVIDSLLQSTVARARRGPVTARGRFRTRS